MSYQNQIAFLGKKNNPDYVPRGKKSGFAEGSALKEREECL